MVSKHLCVKRSMPHDIILIEFGTYPVIALIMFHMMTMIHRFRWMGNSESGILWVFLDIPILLSILYGVDKACDQFMLVCKILFITPPHWTSE